MPNICQGTLLLWIAHWDLEPTLEPNQSSETVKRNAADKYTHQFSFLRQLARARQVYPIPKINILLSPSSFRAPPSSSCRPLWLRPKTASLLLTIPSPTVATLPKPTEPGAPPCSQNNSNARAQLQRTTRRITNPNSKMKHESHPRTCSAVSAVEVLRSLSTEALCELLRELRSQHCSGARERKEKGWRGPQMAIAAQTDRQTQRELAKGEKETHKGKSLVLLCVCF